MSRVKCLTLLLMSIFSLTGYVAPETEPSPQPNIPRRGEGEEQVPLIMIAILARNAAHTLPNFLGYLESLDYPKHRLAVWIRTDHNEDDTLSMLSEWAGKVQDIYSSVDLEHKEEWLYPSRHPFKKTEERYSHVSQLRQEGLHAAREMKAQYLLLLDTDVFIVNNQTLRILLDQHKPMISPMLEAGQEIAYSNFWCGQDEQGYYKRTPEYLPTVKRERRGCFEVLVLHSLLLIDLQTPESRKLQFWPLLDGFKGPVDDVVHFAYSAKVAGLGMYILNTERFGYIIKKENIYDTLSEAARHFLNFKLENLVNHPPVLYSQYIPRAVPEKDKQGLDEIYMISLERRPERRNRMLACLDELRLNFILFDAVDGKKLNQTYLDQLGISYLPGWKDPWGERPMTFGEVGCFLSHYRIWEQMLERGLEEVLVLEDDVDFEPNFRENLEIVLNEAQEHAPSWDLIYVGRKILYWENEKLLSGTTMLSIPHYSYWTLGYIISLRGAQKLIDAGPFDNLLPVDEYLPIMFDAYIESNWASYFPNRNLEAYSASPLLVNPTHYVGDEGWFSDTEPPIEVLERIRARKIQQQKELEEREQKELAEQEKIKEQVTKRQIEAMRAKLKPKSEL